MQPYVVFWVNIEAKSNKFKVSTILVQNRKQVNVARLSTEENLIDWWVGCWRQIARGIYTPLLRVGCLSRGSGQRRTRREVKSKSTLTIFGWSLASHIKRKTREMQPWEPCPKSYLSSWLCVRAAWRSIVGNSFFLSLSGLMQKLFPCTEFFYSDECIGCRCVLYTYTPYLKEGSSIDGSPVSKALM